MRKPVRIHFGLRASFVYLAVHLWLQCPIALSLSSFPFSVSTPKGCAANPIKKRKIVVLGSGGYMGAITFGFLQRASSLYGTGIGAVRCLGATADTSVRLNRVLSKSFALAVADESVVKLTNFDDINSIRQRLDGWDALVLGNDLTVNRRPCTANTFEKSPNDKTWEIYWDKLKTDSSDDSNTEVKSRILGNVLQAAQMAGIQHVIGVNDQSGKNHLSLSSHLAGCGIPYTCIEPCGDLIAIPDYSYRKGVVGQLTISPKDEVNVPLSSIKMQLSREDVASLCVQSLQSLDWSRSRSLQVACTGPLAVSTPSGKRPDQEWCVESRQLEVALGCIG